MYIDVYEYHKMYQLCCECERINRMLFYELISYCKDNYPYLLYDIDIKNYDESVALRQTLLLIKLSDLSVMFSRNK